MPRDYRDYQDTEILIQDIEWLGSFHLSREVLLDRLGILDETLRRRLQRVGRLDLWERYFSVGDEREIP